MDIFYFVVLSLVVSLSPEQTQEPKICIYILVPMHIHIVLREFERLNEITIFSECIKTAYSLQMQIQWTFTRTKRRRWAIIKFKMKCDSLVFRVVVVWRRLLCTALFLIWESRYLGMFLMEEQEKFPCASSLMKCICRWIVDCHLRRSNKKKEWTHYSQAQHTSSPTLRYIYI